MSHMSFREELLGEATRLLQRKAWTERRSRVLAFAVAACPAHKKSRQERLYLLLNVADSAAFRLAARRAELQRILSRDYSPR